MYEDTILTTREGGVLTLTFNRPAAFNSFTQPMAAALQEQLRSADADSSVRCVVLTGAGKAFCAGQDLKEITGENAPTFEEIVGGSYNATVRLIRGLQKPVIAAVNGVAAGAGANIALACDLCVAAEGAKFIQAFSKIGLIPDSGGTWMLPRLVGLQRAIPCAVGPIAAPATDLSFERGVEQQVGTELFGLLWRHIFGVIGDTCCAVVVGHSREAIWGDFAEGVCHCCHDIGHVRNIGFVELCVHIVVDPTLIPADA